VGAVGEQHQRHRRHDSDRQHEKMMPRINPPKRALAGVRPPEQQARRDGKEHDGLDGQARERSERRAFPAHGVAGPGARQRQRDPGHVADADQQKAHAQGRQRDRHPLQPAQPLLQEHATQRDIAERGQKIPETRFQDVAGVHRPHIDRPVGRQQQAAGKADEENSRVGEGRTQFAQGFLQRHHAHEQEQRPRDPVRNQLKRRDLVHLPPVDRHDAPDEEPAGRSERPAKIGAGGGRGGHAQPTCSRPAAASIRRRAQAPRCTGCGRPCASSAT